VLQKGIGLSRSYFLQMLYKSVSKFSTPGQIDLRAFLAGNDVLFPEDVP
jgi:hypothetical protein